MTVEDILKTNGNAEAALDLAEKLRPERSSAVFVSEDGVKIDRIVFERDLAFARALGSAF